MAKSKIEVIFADEKIKNYAYRPTTKLSGILLFCPGFPGTNRLPKLAHRMNDSGIMLVELNYSGTQESTSTFSFYKCMKNIELTGYHLRRQFPGKKIVALGYSVGALYLANVAYKKPQLFDKIILANPILTPKFLLENPLMPDLWKIAKRILKLEKAKHYESEIYSMLSQNDPLMFAGKIITPTEFVLSEKDEIASNANARVLYAKLKTQAGLSLISRAKHELVGDERELVAALLR